MEKQQVKQKGAYIGVALMVVAALCTAFGQLFWKLSQATLNIYFISGFALYFLGAVLMIVAFRFGKLSILHPILGIGYVISSILGSVFLNETIGIYTILGIGFIMAGVFLIGGESN